MNVDNRIADFFVFGKLFFRQSKVICQGWIFSIVSSKGGHACLSSILFFFWFFSRLLSVYFLFFLSFFFSDCSFANFLIFQKSNKKKRPTLSGESFFFFDTRLSSCYNNPDPCRGCTVTMFFERRKR